MSEGGFPAGRTALTALSAGLAAAVVEMVFVLPIQGLLGASPMVVFQSIAAGALGKAAYSLGLSSAGLGLAVHVLVSLVAAALFVLAAGRWDVLLRRPVASGVLYGAPVYVVMTFIVIPLSKIGFHWPKSLGLFSLSFGVHLFAFGLPISLVSWAMLRRRPI